MPPKPSALFRYIERLQGETPWGRVLDAGAGANSTGWIAGLETESWTAVTGSLNERDWTQDAVATRQRPQDRIIVGNWADETLLKGERFDTVLADYLLGAIEGFAPYLQAYLFSRLRPLVGESLYLTGLEPYVPTVRPDTKAARIVWEIGRFRDSCMLLSGRMPYREYPAEWVIDHLKLAGFKVETVKHFNRRFGARFINAQIDLCAPALGSLEDQMLSKALKMRGESLRTQALAMIERDGPLRTGHDYVVRAVVD